MKATNTLLLVYLSFITGSTLIAVMTDNHPHNIVLESTSPVKNTNQGRVYMKMMVKDFSNSIDFFNSKIKYPDSANSINSDLDNVMY